MADPQQDRTQQNGAQPSGPQSADAGGLPVKNSKISVKKLAAALAVVAGGGIGMFLAGHDNPRTDYNAAMPPTPTGAAVQQQQQVAPVKPTQSFNSAAKGVYIYNEQSSEAQFYRQFVKEGLIEQGASYIQPSYDLKAIYQVTPLQNGGVAFKDITMDALTSPDMNTNLIIPDGMARQISNTMDRLGAMVDGFDKQAGIVLLLKRDNSQIAFHLYQDDNNHGQVRVIDKGENPYGYYQTHADVVHKAMQQKDALGAQIHVWQFGGFEDFRQRVYGACADHKACRLGGNL